MKKILNREEMEKMNKINVIVCKDHHDMSRNAANEIANTFIEHPSGLYCFAGGDTPVETIEELVKKHNAKEIDLSKAKFIELDEWVNIDKDNPGSCASYLQKNLFLPANISQENYHLFDAKSKDLEAEVKKANTFIEENGGITLTLLGVGVNGHLGFNEPGTSFNQETHIVDLDQSTQAVGQKYFAGEMVYTQGITIGLKQLFDAKTVVIVASGESKKAAVAKLMNDEEPTKKWSVTMMKNHPNCLALITEDTCMNVGGKVNE